MHSEKINERSNQFNPHLTVFISSSFLPWQPICLIYLNLGCKKQRNCKGMNLWPCHPRCNTLLLNQERLHFLLWTNPILFLTANMESDPDLRISIICIGHKKIRLLLRIQTRPIAISRVRCEQRPTDGPTDQLTDWRTNWPTKRLIESRARD